MHFKVQGKLQKSWPWGDSWRILSQTLRRSDSLKILWWPAILLGEATTFICFLKLTSSHREVSRYQPVSCLEELILSRSHSRIHGAAFLKRLSLFSSRKPTPPSNSADQTIIELFINLTTLIHIKTKVHSHQFFRINLGSRVSIVMVFWGWRSVVCSLATLGNPY